VTLSAGDRYFFVHLQKTGGTTLLERLRATFDRADIYPDATDGDAVESTISVRHLIDRWRARRDEIKIVAGHFPLCTAELLGGDFRTVTVLRDPVERTLSYLRHHREMTPTDRDEPLEAVYEDPFRYHGLIHNHMVKMLSLTLEEMTHGALTHVQFTRNHLERAKQRLAKVDVMGVQEQFGEFWSEVALLLGWHLGEQVYFNRTAPVEVSRSFRARIAEDNDLDVELYKYALSLRAERREHRNGPLLPEVGGSMHPVSNAVSPLIESSSSDLGWAIWHGGLR
jgi:hypothetical protein